MQRSIIAAAVIALSAVGHAARAQSPPTTPEPDAFVNQQRAAQERLREEFDRQMDQAGKVAFDWGGWYTLHFFLLDDGVESSRTMRRHDLRLWGRLTLEDGAHELYLRGRTSLVDFNTGDSYNGRDDDVEGPNLERALYRFDLRKALHAYGGRGIVDNLQVLAGRDLVQFGTGLTLSTPLDQVSLRGTLRTWTVTALAGKTVGSTQDFDQSTAADRTRRSFLGGELRYRGLERHEPFAYALWQEDHNSPSARPAWQPFGYESRYFGGGAEGELIDNVRYAVEGVVELGRGYNDWRWGGRNDIHAWACNAELEYLSPGPQRARASVAYLFGSGDGDRVASSTNTIAGNLLDFEDTGFIAFGYKDTGLAFAPRYTNLHAWRMGGSFYPWPANPAFRRLELGSDWYLFSKHHAAAAVSDATADRASDYLGWEMDYFANWKVTTDLAWTVRFGTFFPGDAFSDRTPRTFLLVGMTWSF
ncbi:MAG: alginate export family protein [Planctomycetota bacterium]